MSSSTAPAPLVLASGSPRRRDLLHEAGVRFEVRPADLDERAHPGEAPAELAERLAEEKACAVAERLTPGDARWVLGADTVVVLDGDAIGKPEDADHAVQLLARLCGRTHRVITGVALARTGRPARRFRCESEVTLRDAPHDELTRYVATGEPLDKAGAYALQGEGARFVTDVRGSRSNVIGLPMDETLALLRELGVVRS